MTIPVVSEDRITPLT